MTGFIFLFALLMIAAIIIWSIMNDKVETGETTRGWFAMKDASDGGDTS